VAAQVGHDDTMPFGKAVGDAREHLARHHEAVHEQERRA
jgi:hypothetical protein